ncbi:hypothetical protein B0H19DRAFT_1274093 [Mycena capillaripes]|nr:hypothetical protein B0H19DRAFT_1274093 [Mycena capillaripes]
MPPRHAPTSRVLPGGALETTFQLDTAPPRTPPAPRRHTRRRQPVGEENTGADPSPMRNRRRQYQEAPTPLAAELQRPELTQDHNSPAFKRHPPPTTRTNGRAHARETPVASSSRITLQDDIFAPDRAERPRDLFDADVATNTPNRPARHVHFTDDAESFALSPPPSTERSINQSPAFSTPSHRPGSGGLTPAGTVSAVPAGSQRGNPPAGTQRKAPAGTRQPAAADVRTFFSEMETKNHCLFCQQLRVTHPHVKATAFSLNTSTGTMRKHLYERHADEWISGCDQLGIPITTKDAQPAVEKFRQRYGQQSGTGGTTTGAKGRRPFSHEAFVDALVEFIVGDDQSINVIENEHLRNLFLMLREDLRDSDIPHRSTI